MFETGLLKAIYLGGEKNSLSIPTNEIDNALESNTPIWLHLDYTCQEVIDWLDDTHHIDNWASEALTETDVRSRAIIHKNSFYLSLRSINLNDDQDEEDMISLRIYVKKNLIITTRRRELSITEKVMENIEFEDDIPCELNVLITIIDTITDEINQHIDHTVDHVDEIEEQTLFNHSAAKQDQLTKLRRNILFLKRHITPQREALKQLGLSNASRLQSFQPAIQQLFDSHIRMIEELDLARERCSLLQERISNKLSEQINRRMYLFSLITALFLPISSIASLFGMNLGGIPLSTASWGFGTVCGILFGISFGVFVYLKKKRWF